MVIGIDASRANCKQKTGVEWYSYHLIQELKKNQPLQGVNFILYSPDKLRYGLEKLPKNWREKQLYWPPKYLWTHIRLGIEVFIHPIDLLFVPAHILPVFCSAKAIVTIHDLGFEQFKKQYSLWQRFYYPLAHKLSIKKALKIIVPSNFTKKELISLYKVPENKISVVHLGYDQHSYYLMKDKNSSQARLILEKYKIKKPFFLYVGRLEKKKNINGLIKAYKKFCDSSSKSGKIPQLVLIGKPGYGYEEIMPLIRDMAPRVCKIGYIKSDDLAYLYNVAEAFIFPSLYEGFGMPVLEAMACGCPVLASKIGSIPEVGGTAILYFNPHNIDSIINAMKKIMTDKILVGELRQEGLKRINNFSWKKCARETMEVLLKV